MKVKISEIIELDRRQREINSVLLNEVEFVDDNGEPIQIDQKNLNDFRFCGLNNTDFITSGFYKYGWGTDTEEN